MEHNLNEPVSHSDCPGAIAIIRAAGKLFAQQGFEQVSLNAIAAEAGVSKANIFHHFASKEGLYQAVLVSACRKASQLLNSLLDDNDAFEERFSHFAQAHLEHLFHEREAARLILRELLEGNGEVGRKLPREVVGENFARLVASIRQGQTADSLRSDIDPAIVATILVGANVFFFLAQDLLQHLDEGRFVDSPARYSRSLADLLLRGALNTAPETLG
jgi:TetR/AcrR family transcriptional regulator